jgi:SPP1 gp7 family putative phage head morphogenesis protein
MSASHTHHIDALADAERDPTQTTTLRKRYAQRLRGQLAALSATIREGVRSRDVFRIGAAAMQPADPRDPPVFPFDEDDRKIEAFMRWLRQQEERGVLEVIGRGDNQFVRAAYGRGLQHADTALNAEGVVLPDEQLATLFNAPIHRDALQRLYTRNFSELEGITEAMNQQISRELADGFSRGLNPTAMARNLTDRIDKVGKHRATLLGRTETIRAHSTATLNRFEEAGVDTVTVRAEWTTAGDRRVCPICQTLEGRTMTVEEARSDTFTYQASGDEAASLSGTYPVQPPAHPQCRCSLLPVVST